MAKTAARAVARSASSAGAPGASAPAFASSTVGLNASGGTLSCASQLVRVKRAQPFGVTGGEDLRDRAAGVVGDEVDGAEVERGAELLDHVREAAEREVLVGARRAAAVHRQVEREAAAVGPRPAR